MDIHIGAHEAKTHFSEIINRAAYAGERVIIAREGKPMVALIGLEELQRLEAAAAQHDLEALNTAIKYSLRTVPFQSVLEQYGELFGEKLRCEVIL
jgi:prevent-host-death family protein